MKVDFAKLNLEKPVYENRLPVPEKTLFEGRFPVKLGVKPDDDPHPEEKGCKLPMTNGTIATLSEEQIQVCCKKAGVSSCNILMLDESDSARLRASVAADWIVNTLKAGESVQFYNVPTSCTCWMWPEAEPDRIVLMSRMGMGKVFDQMLKFCSLRKDDNCIKPKFSGVPDWDETLEEIKHIIVENWSLFEPALQTGRGEITWDEAKPFTALQNPPKGLAVAVRTGMVFGTELTELIDDTDAEDEWKALPSIAEQNRPEKLNIRRCSLNDELLNFVFFFTRHLGLFPGEIRPGKIYRTRVGKVMADKGWMWDPAYVFVLPGKCDQLGRYPAVMVEKRTEDQQTSPCLPYQPGQYRLFVDVNWSAEYIGCFGKVGYIDRAQIDEPVRDLIRSPLSDERIFELVDEGRKWDLPEKAAPSFWNTVAVGERLLYRKCRKLIDMSKEGV